MRHRDRLRRKRVISPKNGVNPRTRYCPKNGKEADHAFYMRHRDRLRRKRVISPKNGANPRTRYCPPETEQEMLEREKLEGKKFWQSVAAARNGEDTHVLTLEEAKAIHHATPDPLVMAIAETVAAVPDTGARVPSLKGLLVDAANWNVDREADAAPILALLDHVLPTVARTVPDLPRPLKEVGMPRGS
jgi:hypothetical protein